MTTPSFSPSTQKIDSLFLVVDLEDRLPLFRRRPRRSATSFSPLTQKLDSLFLDLDFLYLLSHRQSQSLTPDSFYLLFLPRGVSSLSDLSSKSSMCPSLSTLPSITFNLRPNRFTRVARERTLLDSGFSFMLRENTMDATDTTMNNPTPVDDLVVEGGGEEVTIIENDQGINDDMLANESGDMDEMRLQFIDSMSLELEADFEINADIVSKGVLATTFGRRTIARGRLRDILTKIWSLSGAEEKTMVVNGTLLNLREWPEDGRWEETDMNKARMWVEAHGLPTRIDTGKTSRVIAEESREYIDFTELPGEHSSERILKSSEPTEYAYPPIGRAVPLYGAWIKVGVPIKSYFDPRIPRLKITENRPAGVRPAMGDGGKGKNVMINDDNDPSQVGRQHTGLLNVRLGHSNCSMGVRCLEPVGVSQEKNTGLGNAGQSSGLGVSKPKLHPMNHIDNRGKGQGDPESGFKWKLFATYGRPYEAEKREFWDELETRINRSSLPWMIMGDLNLIANSWEKRGGRKVSQQDTLILRNFIWNTGAYMPITPSQSQIMVLSWLTPAWGPKDSRGKSLRGRLNDTRLALQRWRRQTYGDRDLMIKHLRRNWLEFKINQLVRSWLAEEEILSRGLAGSWLFLSPFLEYCGRGISYSVLLNGVPQKKFVPQRGLRQGDPLSPFLFLMCHEVLSKLFLQQQDLGLIESAMAIMNCLKTYEKWSGQKCSLDKTSVLFSKNSLPNVRQDVLRLLRVQECGSQGYGWVGFRKMEHMNLALLAKLSVENGVTITSCMGGVLRLEILRENSFWSVESKSHDSTTWKGILYAREILRKGSITLVGSGPNVDIWKQPWIPWLNYAEFLSLMREVRGRSPLLRSIADISSPNGQWNRQRVQEIFGNDMGARICDIQRLPALNSDMLFWKHAEDGEFSVKGALNVCSNSNSHNVANGHNVDIDSKLWKFVWNDKVHFRLSVLIWRVLVGCLPTKDKLHFVMEKTCLLCDSALETSSHLFWECSFTRALWFGGPFSMTIDHGTSDAPPRRMMEILSNIPPDLRYPFVNFFGCLADCVWRTRNDLMFKGTRMRIDNVLMTLHSRYKEISVGCNVVQQGQIRDSRPTQLVHISESNSTFMCMVDASWKEEAAGLAVVLVDPYTGSWKWMAKDAKLTSFGSERCSRSLGFCWEGSRGMIDSDLRCSSPCGSFSAAMSRCGKLGLW
uniref:Reverse transcriptase zinc-binding domain-containing protein n=1 Tax=Cannabis sativa TaxID=3483 RepID=A0A803P7F3_CANSA